MAVELRCPSCRRTFPTNSLGKNIQCPFCRQSVGRLEQLAQVLDQWYQPRKWRVDVLQPTVYYILERLWTGEGQGERLYRGIAPKHANYDVFRGLVTRVVARGVEEGWIDLIFPENPLDEDPVYRLEFRDPERFADEVAKLFPEVDWDEQIEVPSDVKA